MDRVAAWIAQNFTGLNLTPVNHHGSLDGVVVSFFKYLSCLSYTVYWSWDILVLFSCIQQLISFVINFWILISKWGFEIMLRCIGMIQSALQ